MEFFKTHMNGYEVNVIFNGKSYVFFNSWCGIAAVAERDEENGKKFTIYYGNEHLVGGRLGGGSILPYVKRLINKCECRYVQCDVECDAVEADLHNWSARMEIVKR